MPSHPCSGTSKDVSSQARTAVSGVPLCQDVSSFSRGAWNQNLFFSSNLVSHSIRPLVSRFESSWLCNSPLFFEPLAFRLHEQPGVLNFLLPPLSSILHLSLGSLACRITHLRPCFHVVDLGMPSSYNSPHLSVAQMICQCHGTTKCKLLTTFP